MELFGGGFCADVAAGAVLCGWWRGLGAEGAAPMEARIFCFVT